MPHKKRRLLGRNPERPIVIVLSKQQGKGFFDEIKNIGKSFRKPSTGLGVLSGLTTALSAVQPELAPVLLPAAGVTFGISRIAAALGKGKKRKRRKKKSKKKVMKKPRKKAKQKKPGRKRKPGRPKKK